MSGASPLTGEELDAFIEAVLEEDVGAGDATTEACIDQDAAFSVAMVARQTMVVAGADIAAAFFRKLDPDVKIENLAGEGSQIKAGRQIMTISGKARAILTAERSALNLIQHLSGIATLTWRYAIEIDGTGATLLDTRKTLPLYRDLAKYATRMGGARNHRMGLYDAVMIKDNHIVAAGGIAAAVQAVRAKSSLAIQVECDTLDQVKEAIEAGADSLLLDNMSLEDLRTAAALAGKKIPLEASGGVTLKTIGAIAETGVDYISVGRITQSAPAVDIGLDYLTAKK